MSVLPRRREHPRTCYLPGDSFDWRKRIPWPVTRGRQPLLDIRPIVAEANQRWFMWCVGQWLERECPWLFEAVVDGDDCCVCHWPLAAGAFVGAGDGTGQKFAHRECAARQVVEMPKT